MPSESTTRIRPACAHDPGAGFIGSWWCLGWLAVLVLAALWWQDEYDRACLRHDLRADAVTHLAFHQGGILERMSAQDGAGDTAAGWSRRLAALAVPAGVHAAVIDLRREHVVLLADTLRGADERALVLAIRRESELPRSGGDRGDLQLGWGAIGDSGLHLMLVASSDADLGVPSPVSHRTMWLVAVLVLLGVTGTMCVLARNRQRRVETALRDRIAELDRRIRAWAGGSWAHDPSGPLPAYLSAVVDTALQAVEAERATPANPTDQRLLDAAKLLDTQSVPVFIKDRAGRYLYVNASFIRLRHLEGREWLGRGDADLMPEVQARICHQTDETVFSTGLPTVTEEFVANEGEDASGHWALIRKSMVRLPDGRLLLVGMVTGLDERRRTDHLARQGELHYRDLFHHVRDAVLILEGEDGTIVDANQQALSLMRVAAGGLVGRTLPRLCAEPAVAARLCRPPADPGAQPGVQTLGIIADDGTAIDTETTVSWLMLPDGRKIAQVVVRDISERQRALAEALAGQRAKTAFLATMSHELRTPLNGILGLAEVLERGGLDPRQRELMGLLRTSAVRLLELLTNVLEYSRLDAGSGFAVADAFSPRVLVDDLVASAAVGAACKHIDMSAAIANETPAKVLGDPAHLRLALGHIIANAVKFTASGGVSVAVRVVSQDEQRVRLAFAVTDTGIGIPPERCRDLFKPFTQVDASSTRGYEGSGLGLAIVERAVAGMGGTVAVTSAPGAGSTFTIELSLALS